jgi:hypothetical protein
MYSLMRSWGILYVGVFWPWHVYVGDIWVHPLCCWDILYMHDEFGFCWDVASISWIYVIFACFIALIEIGRYKNCRLVDLEQARLQKKVFQSKQTPSPLCIPRHSISVRSPSHTRRSPRRRSPRRSPPRRSPPRRSQPRCSRHSWSPSSFEDCNTHTKRIEKV